MLKSISPITDRCAGDEAVQDRQTVRPDGTSAADWLKREQAKHMRLLGLAEQAKAHAQRRQHLAAEHRLAGKTGAGPLQCLLQARASHGEVDVGIRHGGRSARPRRPSPPRGGRPARRSR